MQPEAGKFDKKCPDCGGTIAYEPGADSLTCPYCGSTHPIAVEDIRIEGAEELDFAAAERAENRNWGFETRTVSCASCGAEAIYDALQLSDTCPYCGANHLVEERKETMAPGGVIPFEIPKKQAGEKFLGWIGRKWFCPKEAKQSATPEKFQGVYLPYWTFDAQTYSKYTARYGHHRTEKDREGNQRVVTDWHRTSGDYRREVDDHLVCATSRQSVAMLKDVEPFSLKANKKYQPEYLAGFISERYSVGLQAGWGTAQGEIARMLDGEIEDKIRQEQRADVVDSLNRRTAFSAIKYKYLLLPVWMSSFRYRDKVYNFLVNGQTGKVGGKYPLSPWRVGIACVLGLMLLALLVYYIGME